MTGAEFADRAENGGYIGIPYSKLDCQGFVERVLKDSGIRKSNGTVYDWRGSNSMYRYYYQWRGTIAECKKQFGSIPSGALVFKMRDDNGEEERGYTDGLGNYYHVGIYIGKPDKCVIHSTTGGVQWAKNLNGWTHVTLLSMLDYNQKNTDNINVPTVADVIKKLKAIITDLERIRT